MLDIVFWMLFLFAPLSMFFLLRITGEQLNQISMVNLVCVALFAFSVLGTLPLFYQLDAYRVATGVTDQKLVLIVTFLSCSSIVVFLFGVIFVRGVLGLKPVPVVTSQIEGLDGVRLFYIFLLLMLVSIVLYIYLGKISQVAIWVAFTEGTELAAVARSKMGNDFPGKYHWYSLAMHSVGTLVTLTFYVAFLLRKNLTRFLLFLVSFSISTFIAVMATEKGPFVNLLISIFMAHYLTRNNGFVPKKDIVVLVFFVILILIIFYIYFMGAASIGSAFMSVFSRAFAGSIQPAYHYLEYFPEHQEFLMGRTFPNPGGVMPFEPFPYKVEIMNWKYPNLAEEGTVGSMPAVFWGEAYANFGYVGIPVVAFMMGVLVAVLSYLVSKLELNPLTIAFTVWVIFHFLKISVTGFSGYLYDFYMIFMTFVLILGLFASGRIRFRS